MASKSTKSIGISVLMVVFQGCSRGGPDSAPQVVIQSPVVALESSVAAKATERALDVVKKQENLPTTDTTHEFKPTQVILDTDGTEHVRFERSYKGLQVVAGDIIIHTSPRAMNSEISTSSPIKFDLQTEPKISKDDALQIAELNFKSEKKELLSSHLVVLNLEQTPKLAWEIFLSGFASTGIPTKQKIYVDASDGKFITALENIFTVNATGKSYYYGTVDIEAILSNGKYFMADGIRGPLKPGQIFDMGKTETSANPVSNTSLSFGDGTLSDPSTLAVDAHFGAAKTWDYFLNVHKRAGIKGDNKGARSLVHFGVNLANAFWDNDNFAMLYGDGDGKTFGPMVGLDVAAHEMAHGITSASAGLVYAGESGGLNEATSDIFAAMVEFYTNHPSDPPDYFVGERIVLSGMPKVGNTAAVRFMHNPPLDGKSLGCWSSTAKSANVHHSSGIGNHFFYLLAEGSKPGAPLFESPTCDNSTVVGIGRDKAARIWYRALTVYMLPTTDYAHARAVTLRAAADLYGKDSTELNTVAAAWKAVSVVNGPPEIVQLASQTISDSEVKQNIALTAVDYDGKHDCTKALAFKSADTNVLPDSSFTATGTTPDCLLSIAPVSGKFGTSKITVTFNDGTTTATSAFDVTVVKAPKLTAISAQSTTEDVPKEGINFQILDASPTVTCATSIQKSSSNTKLISAENIIAEGAGQSCSLKLIPNANEFGTATITLKVSEGNATTQQTFNFSVAAVNDAPVIASVAAQVVDEDIEKSGIAIQVTDVDSTISCSDNIKAVSSNLDVIDSSGIVLSGMAPNCLMSLKAKQNASGVAKITLTVTDGMASAIAVVDVTVNAVDDAPLLKAQVASNQLQGGEKMLIPVTVSDVDNSLTCDGSIKVKSSDEKLLPASQIKVSGVSPQCVVEIVPGNNQNGKVTVQIEVSDGTLSSTQDIEINVAGFLQVVATANVLKAKAPAWIRFAGSVVSQSSKTQPKMTWDFGDETSGYVPLFWKSYTQRGIYKVNLKVKDQYGNESSKSMEVQID